VVSPHLYSNLHNIRRPTSSKVATAADGHSLSISAEGELGPLPSVLLADNIRHNCIVEILISYTYICSMQSVCIVVV
jgi:hypothetical protein